MAGVGIAPHGGRLVNRMASPDEHESLLSEAQGLKRVQCRARELGYPCYIPTPAGPCVCTHTRIMLGASDPWHDRIGSKPRLLRA